MRVMVGMSGYSYDGWKGSFYPEKLAKAKMLGFYAGKLDAVEINNTFYRMPKRSVVENWAAQVPDGFSFSLKATRRITHQKKLEDAGDELEYILSTVDALGANQGPMLFQLPPFLRRGDDRLKGFLDLLPDGFQAAFEFRHESWYCDEIYGALKDAGAALVISQSEKLETPVVATAPYGYLRLRKGQYDAKELDDWADRIRSQPWETVHVYFKHEDNAVGPEMAAAFAARFA